MQMISATLLTAATSAIVILIHFEVMTLMSKLANRVHWPVRIGLLVGQEARDLEAGGGEGGGDLAPRLLLHRLEPGLSLRRTLRLSTRRAAGAVPRQRHVRRVTRC